MSKYWNARTKNTRRFRSSRALKQDRARQSQESWEQKPKKIMQKFKFW